MEKKIAHEILLNGIPYKSNENLGKYYACIYNFICDEIEAASVDGGAVVSSAGGGGKLRRIPRIKAIFRLNTAINSVGTILICFLWLFDKENFMRKYKQFLHLGRNLTLSTIKFIADSDDFDTHPNLQSIIYATENLPKSIYEIILKIKTLRRQNLIQRFWVNKRNFKVFILTNENVKLMMNSCHDVDKFAQDLDLRSAGSKYSSNVGDATVTTTVAPIASISKLTFGIACAPEAIPKVRVKSTGDGSAGVSVVPTTTTATVTKYVAPPTASTSKLTFGAACAFGATPKVHVKSTGDGGAGVSVVPLTTTLMKSVVPIASTSGLTYVAAGVSAGPSTTTATVSKTVATPKHYTVFH